MNYGRKKCRIRSFTRKPGPDLLVFVNNCPLRQYDHKALELPALKEILLQLPPMVYDINTSGGGIGSLKEVVAKQLLACLDEKSKNELRLKYPELTKTDTRVVQPKKAGGKARARTQKSYR